MISFVYYQKISEFKNCLKSGIKIEMVYGKLVCEKQMRSIKSISI